MPVSREIMMVGSSSTCASVRRAQYPGLNQVSSSLTDTFGICTPSFAPNSEDRSTTSV